MTDYTLKDPNNQSGPVSIRSTKVTVDRDLCIGAATCIAIAPKAFALDNEAKAVVIDTIDTESDETILDAAKGCPTAAIIIEDESGNKIFPA